MLGRSSRVLSSLPEMYKCDRVLHAQAACTFRMVVHLRKIPRSNCFPTCSERSALIELWWNTLVLEAESEKGGEPLVLVSCSPAESLV